MVEAREKMSYEDIIKNHPEFEGVIHQRDWDYIGHSDKGTINYLGQMWEDNLVKNIDRKLWRRSGGVADACRGIGRNKALIGIGAGPSLKKNYHVLKQVYDFDSIKPWPERNFIFVASNHMYKPLLKDGIIPDFVILTDGSDVVMDQLTKDIPEHGRYTVLLAGLHCSPKVLKKWMKQGREIKFYLTYTKGLDTVFEKKTGKNAKHYQLLQGGNVMNTTWSLGLKNFGCTVFMALGNDLSFPRAETREEQREGYYADGDYSTNKATGRDEGRNKFDWMGFIIKKRVVYAGPNVCPYDIEIEPVRTSKTLWVYKTWLEANVLAGTSGKIAFHYYNCSEGGIAGVKCKDDTVKGLLEEKNWFLLDEVTPRWKTRMLEDAAEEFVRIRRHV